MRFLIFLISLSLFSFSCGEIDELSKTVCDTPCYLGPAHTLDVGVCRAGTPVCDENGELISCEGQITPGPVELCNGVDDDCNGVVDDGVVDSWINTKCEGLDVGWCRPGTAACVQGKRKCLNKREPRTETCNLIDDDCNGVKDDIPPELCYSGDVTKLLPPCRPGVTACSSHGDLICSYEVTPTLERCNGVDDDCNGRVDDGLPVSVQPTDILIYLDTSESASFDLPSVHAALIAVYTELSKTSSTTVRVGIVTYPHPADGDTGRVLIPVMFLPQFLDVLTRINIQTWGGVEPAYDVAYLGAAGFYGTQWRTGADVKHVVISDECTPTTTLPTPTTVRALIDRLRSLGHTYYAFSTTFCRDEHEAIAVPTGGRVFPLRPHESIEPNLATVIEPICTN